MRDAKPGRFDINKAVVVVNWGCLIIGGGIVLLFVFASAISGFMSMQGRSKESTIKHSMQILESAVIDYATAHRGYYPADIESIVSKRHDLANPISKKWPAAITCDTMHLRLRLKHGQIAYVPLLISAKGSRSYAFFAKGHSDYLLDFRIWGDTMQNAK
jgi:hypothetical protein